MHRPSPGFVISSRLCDILLVEVSFLYMAHAFSGSSPLRVGERFLGALCRNVNQLALGEDYEVRMQAFAIVAFSRDRSRKTRLEACHRALDMIDAVRESEGI